MATLVIPPYYIHKMLRASLGGGATPSYALLKRLNNILTLYKPTTYSLSSTKEFIDILKLNSPNTCIASLDVESLFTNVLVNRTTDRILDYAFHHPTLPPPKLPRNILRGMVGMHCRDVVPLPRRSTV